MSFVLSHQSDARHGRIDPVTFTTRLCLSLPRRGTARVTGTVIDAHARALTCQLQSDTVNKETRVKAQIRTHVRVRAPTHEHVAKHRRTPGLTCKSCFTMEQQLRLSLTHTHTLYSTDGVQQSRWRAFISYCVGGMAN